MQETRRLWIILGTVIFCALFILGWFGHELYRQVPPIPLKVQTGTGRVLMTRDNILAGQQAWQSMGGQQVGSVWGHGAYQAPDWSADWLHREATALRQELSRKFFQKGYNALDGPRQAAIDARLRTEMRTNTYDPHNGVVTVSPERAAAMAQTAAHYQALFGGDPSLARLRAAYALQSPALPDETRRKNVTAFFFWTAWAATTRRPGTTVTYTNNWPHEPLVGNDPTPASLVWSLVSIAFLLAGVGGLVLMIALSLLPIGLMQTWASIEHGLWFARSAAFLQQPLLQTLRWLRTIGDAVFIIGTGALAYFVIGLKTGWSYAKSEDGRVRELPSRPERAAA
jgi:nitric oxide reductase subunit B